MFFLSHLLRSSLFISQACRQMFHSSYSVPWCKMHRFIKKHELFSESCVYIESLLPTQDFSFAHLTHAFLNKDQKLISKLTRFISAQITILELKTLVPLSLSFFFYLTLCVLILRHGWILRHRPGPHQRFVNKILWRWPHRRARGFGELTSHLPPLYPHSHLLLKHRTHNILAGWHHGI